MRNFKFALAGGLVLGITVASLGLAFQAPAQEAAQFVNRAEVHVYPHTLTPKDKLSVKGQAIDIKAETTLIWVDLQPGARYGHGTEFILISAAGTQVVKANWWGTINGKDFRPTEKYKLEFPFQVVGK